MPSTSEEALEHAGRPGEGDRPRLVISQLPRSCPVMFSGLWPFCRSTQRRLALTQLGCQRGLRA